MTTKGEEDYALSLYYSIYKNEEWRRYHSGSYVMPGWTLVGIDDSDWELVTLGTPGESIMYTQYYHKQFVGSLDMAAYESHFYYQYGIVAYINGVEFYRDHMPEGPVSPSTSSLGVYLVKEYHGVIRPGGEITPTPSALAVELHFPQYSGAMAPEFNAFMAFLASSTPVGSPANCFVYPYAVSLTSYGFNATHTFDFDRDSFFSSSYLPTSVFYAFQGSRAHINGLRIWPAASVATAPSSFSWDGRLHDYGSFNSVFSISGATYHPNAYSVFYGYLQARPYSSFRLVINEAIDSASVSGFEVQPLTCHFLLPSGIDLEPSFVFVYAHYQSVTVHPTIQEFVNCTITPALPSGLSFDADTCTVSGVPSVPLPATSFWVTSHVIGRAFSGSFMLAVLECSSMFTEVVRTYQSDAASETFSLTDTDTGEGFLYVGYNTSQTNNRTWRQLLCLNRPRVEVTVNSSNAHWQSGSFLLLRAMLTHTEYEPIARIHYDSITGTTKRDVNLNWLVAPRSPWEYAMGEIPQNWDTLTNWAVGTAGAFPASSNQFQLYKKTFDVAVLEGVSALVLSLRFQYGCVILLNGVEVFRQGLVGAVTPSSTSSHAYADLRYRHISLPVKTIPTDTAAEQYYLQMGANTLVVGLVAQEASQTAAVFDCALHLLSVAEVSRMMDFSITSTGIGGNPACAADQSSECVVTSNACSNYWQVTFDHARREWVSSLTLSIHPLQGDRAPRQFAVKARNSDEEAWTTLKQVVGLGWFAMGETKRIWLENNQPWNQYRLEDITGDSQECTWQLGGVDLLADTFLAQTPDLMYDTPVVVHRDTHMTPLYPNSQHYYDFSITPSLPDGLSLDANSGVLSGFTHALLPRSTFIINAKRAGGGVSTTFILLSVEACAGLNSLITLTARLDDAPFEASYRLFSGRGTTGSLVASADAFLASNGLNYADWCLPQGLYTLQLRDAPSTGWTNPAGWWLSVDAGETVFEAGQVPYGVDSVVTSFSSLLPFQVEVDEWKLFNSENAVSEDWRAVEFDDSEWQTVKAAAMGNHVGTTAYIRREVSIPNLEDYHVLNVRVKYAGGMAVYFNGNLVARFNLPYEFDGATEALTTHDASLFSKFHVILSTVNAVADKNVMAFEVHRSADQSAIVFDATGVFGVNECSVVLNTFSAIESSTITGCTKEDLFDLNPSTFGSLANTVGSFIEWTVENLEGSKFSSFALQASTAVTGFAFALSARFAPEDSYAAALQRAAQAVQDRQRTAWRVAVALAGFRQFKFEVTAPASAPVGVNAVLMQYCLADGNGCAGDGRYPPVNEGEVSSSTCPVFFHGYAYRECSGGVLGPARTEHCVYDVPTHLAYNQTEYVFEIDMEGTTGIPAVRNIVFGFSIDATPALPQGLAMNTTTGEISGIPTVLFPARQFTLRATNPSGEATAVLTLSVQRTDCKDWKACKANTLACSFVEDSMFDQFICRGGRWLLVSSCHAELYDAFYRTRLTGQFYAVPKEPMLEYAIVSGALPDGLTLDNRTGIIAGVPAKMGSFNVTIATRSETCLSTSYFIRFSVEQSLLVSLGFFCLYTVIAPCVLFIVVDVIVCVCRKRRRELVKQRRNRSRV